MALTQSQVAEYMKVTRAAVGQWEAGTTEPTASKLLQLSTFLQMENNAESLGPQKAASKTAGRKPDNQSLSNFDFENFVPVISTAEWLDNDRLEGDFILRRNMIINVMARPTSARAFQKLKALYVSTTKLEPRFYQGEVIFIDEEQEARSGDYVVVTIRVEGDEQDDYKILRSAYIGKLINRTSSSIRLLQHNPESYIDLETTRVDGVARVVPWIDLIAPR